MILFNYFRCLYEVPQSDAIHCPAVTKLFHSLLVQPWWQANCLQFACGWGCGRGLSVSPVKQWKFPQVLWAHCSLWLRQSKTRITRTPSFWDTPAAACLLILVIHIRHNGKLSRAMRAPWVDRFLNNEIYCYLLFKKRCGPPVAIPSDHLAGGIVTSGRQQRNVPSQNKTKSKLQISKNC